MTYIADTEFVDVSYPRQLRIVAAVTAIIRAHLPDADPRMVEAAARNVATAYAALGMVGDEFEANVAVRS